MWTYPNETVSTLLFSCLISLGINYIKMLGFLHFLTVSFLKGF